MRNISGRGIRWAAIGLACLAALGSAPLAIAGLGSQGIELPGVQSAQRLMAMLDARSPGEREKGELAQTKIKHKLAQNPRERALGKTFPPKPSPAEQLAKVIVPAPPIQEVAAPPIPPLVPPAAADIISPASLIANAPLAIGSAVIGGSVLGPPSGSAPPPGSSPPPTSEVPPVTSPVPEPASWLMMLLGFGIVGSAARRRQRVSLAPA